MLLKKPPEQTKQNDELEIRHLLKEIIVAFNNSDIETLLSLHSDDVILMDPGMPLIQGKKRIREMFGRFHERQIQIQLAYDIHELEADDRLAYIRGTVYKTNTIQQGKPQHENYRFICLFKKQENNQWLRTHVIVNSDKAELQLDKLYELYHNWDGAE